VRSTKAYSSKMGVKARKKAITKKLKNGASDKVNFVQALAGKVSQSIFWTLKKK